MTTYYLDFNRGNDNNSGTSKETPWQNLTKIATIAAQAGDQFLLADDSVWTPSLTERVVVPNTWQGTKQNPVIIGKYNYYGIENSQKKPTIIWNKKIQVDEWVYSIDNNAWTYTHTANVGSLCLLRLNNTWAASYVDSGLPVASIEGRYFVSGSVLYLYAPANIDPTTFYKEVLFSPNTGYFSFSTNRHHIVIQDLYFENTSTAILAYSESATNETVVTAKRISGKTVSALIRAGTGGTGGKLSVFFHDNEIHDWGAAAIQTYTATGTGMVECEIFNNRIDDGLHCYSQGAIYIQSRSPGLTTKVYNNHITNVRWGTRDKTFDGCAIYTETVSGGVDVYSNWIENCYCAFQDNSGRTTRWIGNVIKNCWSFIRVSDEKLVDETNIYIANNTCILGTSLSPTFGSGFTETGIRVYKPTGAAVVLNVYNNILYNPNNAVRAAILTPQTGWSGDIKNNCIFSYPYVAQQEFSPFIVQTDTGSILEKPELSFFSRPSKNSFLIAAGSYLGNLQDNNSTTYWNPPTIGAFEYIRPRTMRS